MGLIEINGQNYPQMKLNQGYYVKPPHENLLNSTSIGAPNIQGNFHQGWYST